MELKHRNVNMARTVLDRAVTSNANYTQAWLRRVYVEEVLGDPAKARAVYSRWASRVVLPRSAWVTWAQFEEREGSETAVRQVMKQYAGAHPSAEAFVAFARFEEQKGYGLPGAREVYEGGLNTLVGVELERRGVDVTADGAGTSDMAILFLAYARAYSFDHGVHAFY